MADEIFKISKDKERARDLLVIAKDGLKVIDILPRKMSYKIIVEYYEIIKELITAILLSDEYKTLSHKDLIDSLKERQKELSENEISLIDSLRILRNRITYEGFQTNKDYLTRNEPSYKSIITKLKSIIKTKLKCQ